MNSSTPTPSDFDALKAAWTALDQRLATLSALQLDAARVTAADRRERRVRASVRALRPLLFGQLLQALVGAGVILLAASFWAGHTAHLALLLSGLALHGYGIFLLGSAVVELRLLAGIRYTTPVLELQKQLATLRAWRRRNGLVFLYGGCFLWIPLMLVVFAGWGVDLWTQQPLVVASFFVSGAVCALGASLGLRWAARRPTLAAALEADAAGQSLRRAELELAEVLAFEREG
ncbi:MAG: hypothetical protein MUE46_03745 [Xanthomonadales bacterium]|jgi:hypothetical protein|nr:hypothetical protein [Xanthomonadales bacterium]